MCEQQIWQLMQFSAPAIGFPELAEKQP